MTSVSDYSQEFVSNVARGKSLQDALAPSLTAEAELRRLYATDRDHEALKDPFVGLVDVFASSEAVRLIQARKIEDQAAKDAKYIFPLKSDDRRPTGAQAMAPNIESFRTCWNIFTEGALSQLTDWNNVVAGGGSVLACSLPLPEHAQGSKRAIRKYFHEQTYSTSDIDLFLYGLTPEQAEKKATQIYEAVRDSVPWDTVCVRTKHAISIHSQYPYRPIQIILRLYKSPSEILAGFDIDCAGFLYDGSSVWGNPRGIAALMSQSNLVDMTRRSPSYEVRLAKYAVRGFEVHVPALSRDDIDPTIYERSINRIEGLARLLVLEKLSDPDDRTKYLEHRRTLRGRPDTQGYSRRAMRRRRKVHGDLKAAAELFGGVSASDYGTQSFHIPYGPGFDSKKVEKFIYGTDLGMNSTFNPKNKDRRLHRHPAFFGTMEEVLGDCCEYCPDPLTAEEKELQLEEDKQYIRGRIEFMQEDPGRQMMTGSFHPIDEGEWAIQAYLGPVEKLFRAVADGDLETVGDLVEAGFDLKKRDHVGRTTLHLSIMSKSDAIASYLVDSGARITARLVDGRTPLHLASQLGMTDLVSKILERSKANEKKAEEERAAAEAAAKEAQKDEDGDNEMGDKTSNEEDDEDDMNPSSEDDWDSDEEGHRKKRKAATPGPATTVNSPPAEGADIPEDNEELPDILDINAVDWDFGYSPLSHAIVAGHLPVVDVLIRAGADVTTPFKRGEYTQTTFYPLTLTLLTEDTNQACAIAERLLESGASCTAADDSLKTVFHQAVLAGSLALVKTFIRVDPRAATVINFLPQLSWNEVVSPLASAVGRNDRAMTALLISSGASLNITPEMFDKSWDARYSFGKKNQYIPQKQENQWLKDTCFPVEPALGLRSDLVIPIIQLGADLNLGMRQDNQYNYSQTKKIRRTILDVLRESIKYAEKDLAEYKRLEGCRSTIKAPVPATQAAEDWISQLEESSDTLEGWITGQIKRGTFQASRQGMASGLQGIMETSPTQTTVEVVEENPSIPYKALISSATMRLEWLREVESIVVANGGKTAKELNPPEDEDEVAPVQPVQKLAARPTVAPPVQTKTVSLEYQVYRSSYQSHPVAAHLKARYAQLFTACWKGDTHTVERLCLPSKSGKRDRHATFLQITAEVLPVISNVLTPGFFGPSVGYSTLAIAVLAKRWDTAKAILSIAKAQYEKSEEEERVFQPFGNSDDSDEEYDSDMSVDDYDEPISKPQLVDLANRLSTVRTDVDPARLFAAFYVTRPEETKPRRGTPVTLALEYADVQEFDEVLALGKMCDPHITINPADISSVIKSDEPAMLDFIIRRFGFGLPTQEEEEHEHENEHDGEGEGTKRKKVPKTYLGLNVQGRKRKDLAAKGDPDAPMQITESRMPLIWQAAQVNAPKILAWLATSSPLEAYKAYMQVSSDEAALAMKRIPKFEQRFPSLIGSTVTEVGENVMLAHLSGGSAKLETVKLLFTLFPGLKTAFVYNKLEGLRMTGLMYICAGGLSTELFDYFLGRGSDPLCTDYRGCNILHMAASKSHVKLFKHIFTKLNRDQLALLLSQPTHETQNTPLMTAIELGNITIVEFLLSFDHPVTSVSLATRDCDGNLPLHAAICNGHKEIVKLLLKSSPKMIFVEDGLGSTPLEEAELRYMLWLSNNRVKGSIPTPGRWIGDSQRAARLEDAELDVLFGSNWLRQQFRGLPEYGEVAPSDVQTLDVTVQKLDAEGSFTQQPNVKQVLEEYVKRCHAAAVKWEAFSTLKKEVKEAEERETGQSAVVPEYKCDSQDLKGTYEVIRDAVKASGTKKRRDLVHLLDAQRAVHTALKFATKKEDKDQFEFVGQSYSRHRYGYRGRAGPEDLDLSPENKKSIFQFSLWNLNVLNGEV